MSYVPDVQSAQPKRELQGNNTGGNKSASEHNLVQKFEAAARDVATTVREHPYAALAVATGLAFSVGALWKLRRPSQQSQLENLMGRLPDFVNAKQLKSYFR